MKTNRLLFLVLVSVTSVASAKTLHVRDFGNDLNRAISFSAVGDTVSFDGITATLGQVNLPGGRTYDGGGATLTAAPGKYVFQLDPNNATNITIQNVNFTGRSIRGEAQNQTPTNIHITGCTFGGQLYVPGQGEPQAIYELGWVNSSIDHNTFTCFGDGGVVGYGGNNLSITDNTFHDGSEGVHIIGHYGPPGSLTVSRNHFVNMARMDAELQGDWLQVTVEDNWCGEPNWATTDALSVMALSVATDGAQKEDIHRNFIFSHGSTTYEKDGATHKTGLRLAIEIGADPKVSGAVDCSDNYIDEVLTQDDGAAIAISTSTGTKVHDNHITGGPIATSFGKDPVITNNDANVAVTWDINRTYPLGVPQDTKVTRAATLPSSSTVTPRAPLAIPGVIQAEEFDPDNRTTPVSLETAADVNGGQDVDRVVAGEWLAYTTSVANSASYTLNIRIASGSAGGVFHIESDGADITGPMTFPNTGGWQAWQTLSKSGIALTAGTHVLRLVIDSTPSDYIGNLNWFSFTPDVTQSPATPSPATQPTRAVISVDTTIHYSDGSTKLSSVTP